MIYLAKEKLIMNLIFVLGWDSLLSILNVKMSGGSDRLALKEDDVTKMLAATTHIGSTNVDFQMEQYVYKRRSDGNYYSICTHVL